MRIIYIICTLIFLTYLYPVKAQDAHKIFFTKKVDNPPKIDGHLDDDIWKNAPVATNFIQFEPYNGINPSQKTNVKMVYSNAAIYIAAILYDKFPDSISTNLSKRDEGFDAFADLFVCIINPFNDGINSYEFTVTASGVQNDIKHSGINADIKWDAVWKSEAVITDIGWQVEMEIPYSALRFPKKEVQDWG